MIGQFLERVRIAGGRLDAGSRLTWAGVPLLTRVHSNGYASCAISARPATGASVLQALRTNPERGWMHALEDGTIYRRAVMSPRTWLNQPGLARQLEQLATGAADRRPATHRRPLFPLLDASCAQAGDRHARAAAAFLLGRAWESWDGARHQLADDDVSAGIWGVSVVADDLDRRRARTHEESTIIRILADRPDAAAQILLLLRVRSEHPKHGAAARQQRSRPSISATASRKDPADV